MHLVGQPYQYDATTTIREWIGEQSKTTGSAESSAEPRTECQRSCNYSHAQLLLANFLIFQQGTPQNPAPAPGRTLSQADCDKEIARILGQSGAVAATVNEPSILQHRSQGLIASVTSLVMEPSIFTLTLRVRQELLVCMRRPDSLDGLLLERYMSQLDK